MPINTLIIIQICNNIVKYMNISMIRRTRVAFGLGSDPVLPTEEVSTLAAEACGRVSRLIGSDAKGSDRIVASGSLISRRTSDIRIQLAAKPR
jgi:hypothetical protein